MLVKEVGENERVALLVVHKHAAIGVVHFGTRIYALISTSHFSPGIPLVHPPFQPGPRTPYYWLFVLAKFDYTRVSQNFWIREVTGIFAHFYHGTSRCREKPSNNSALIHIQRSRIFCISSSASHSTTQPLSQTVSTSHGFWNTARM